MNLLRKSLTIFNFVFVVVMSLLFVYWYFIDGVYIGKPIIAYNDPHNIQVDKERYTEGDEIKIASAFCKTRNVSGVTQWVLIDTIMRFYPPNDPTNLPIGCYGVTDGKWNGTFSHAVYLPPGLPNDLYYLVGTRVIQINPIKSITLEYQTEEFIVY